MSSFNKNNPHQAEQHRIFYGANEANETTFSDAQQVIYVPLWDETTEKEYMERVKTKAKEEATKILQTALREAEEMKAKAKEEGFSEGERNARAKIEKTSIEYVRYFESILNAIEEYSKNLYTQMEDDITEIIETAVERITSIVLTENNKEVIQKTLEEAVQLISMDKEFIISVNPEDYQSVVDVIHTIYELHPSSKHWHVQKNADIPLGSCQFEDAINVISVNRQKRKEKVMEIISTIQFIKE